MGFLSSLFGNKGSKIETEEQVISFINETEVNSLQDPKSALKQIKNQRKSECFQNATRIGGQYHEQFQKVVFKIWDQTEPNGYSSMLPTVEMISWEKVYKLKSIFELAQPVQMDIICLVPEKQKYDLDSLGQLIVLRDFIMDPKLAIVIGEMDDKWLGPLFLRKAFIDIATQELDPEIEEIIQEFIDFAKKHGLGVKEF